MLRRTGGFFCWGPAGFRGARATTCGGGADLRKAGCVACVQRASRLRERVCDGRFCVRPVRGSVCGQKYGKTGKSVSPGPFEVSECRALSAQRCACIGCAFLSFGYDYEPHDYGILVLNAVLEIVVSFCDQLQSIVAASGSWVRRGGALM